MKRARLHAAAVAACALLAPGLAWAEEGGLRDLCAERPGSATPPCIVDRGHLIAEVDAFDVTHDRQDGVSQQTTVALSPHLRLGLTDTVEAGLQLQPVVEQRLRDSTAGTRETARGFGDASAEMKISLTRPDGGGVSVAVLPFVTLPTAKHGLGAGGFQGGLILPVSIALADGFSLALSPEIDVRRNGGGGGGVHEAYTGVISLGRSFPHGLNGAIEIVGSLDDAKAERLRQTLAGASLAWIPASRADVQLDVGCDVGLNRGAPDRRIYVGVSRRF